MPEIICFIGVIGSGKDYRADKLVQNQGFIKVKIADEIYKEAEKEFDIDLYSYDNKEKFKVSDIVVGQNVNKLTNQINPNLAEININKVITGREYLNHKGTFRRERDEDYWIYQWWGKVKPLIDRGKNVTCSDVRYLNELRFLHQCKKSIENLDVKFMFTNYKSYKYNPDFPHESERLAQKILADGWQDNDTLPDNYVKKLVECKKP